MKKIFLFICLICLLALQSHAQSYFHPTFNSLPAGWQNLDQDGDGYKWIISGGTAYSYSWTYNGGNLPLRPNNWLITNAIDLTEAVSTIELQYMVAGANSQYYQEHYKIMLSTTGNSVADFTTTLHEETLPSGGSWLSRTVDMSPYVGQTIYLAFVHCNCTDIYTLYLSEPQIVGPNEIELSTLKIDKYIEAGSDIPVKGVIYNNGASALTSFDLTYSVNGGEEVETDHITGLNIAKGGAYTFTHSIQIPTTVTEKFDIAVKVSHPNGGEDYEADNEASTSVQTYEYATHRKTLLEQFTTAQCSNCPTASSGLNSFTSTRPDVVWIAHHGGYYTDGLTHNATVNQFLAFYNDGGNTYAPALMADRTWWAPNGDPGPVFGYSSGNLTVIDKALAVPSFVSVDFKDASYDEATRQVTITVYGEIVNDILLSANDLRLSFYLIEDNLKTTPGQAGSSLGTNYIHNHVVRTNISDIWGDQNVIADNVKGTTYSKTYTYTIPNSYDADNLTFVAFVTRHNSDICNRDVLNANKVKIADFATLSIDDNHTGSVKIYPNPATDFLYLETAENILKIEILNLEGQLIRVMESADDIVPVNNLSNGIYFLRCTTDKGVVTKKFVKE